MERQHLLAVLQALRSRLEPPERASSLMNGELGLYTEARKAAVLLPLFESAGELFLIFIRRSEDLRAHSGEIAFPGGRAEAGDSSPLMTALRESQEEIGLETDRVEVLGVLPPVFTLASNHLIMPVVAYLPEGPGDLQLQASEVKELIIAPLNALADPAIARSEQWMRAGEPRTVYFYDYGPYCIWGATGRILKVFLERIGALS
jgi:8-oxo-dGTP pyrophosphatase MutT (NUDIX family)